MNTEIALSLRNIHYSHEKGKALNDCSVDIPKSNISVVLGPNGAGKSILLKLCHGLLEPSAGTIETEDDDISSAMVFPKPTLLKRSVLENMIYVINFMGIEKSLQSEIALAALKEFSMDKYADYPARLLSSGEQQKLSLIRALLLKPDILYLDEPTSNLDPEATATLEQMITRSRNNDVTVVMATHDLMQARRIAEQVIYIENGSILEVSKADQFFSEPRNKRAKRFIEGKL